MATTSAANSFLRAFWLLVGAALLAVVVWMGVFRNRNASNATPPADKPTASKDEHGHDHDHDHPGHSDSTSLTISEQARRNIGLQLMTVALQPFDKTITVPGIVVERPGRTTIDVAAPMTGVITKIAVVQGEAVHPGQLLFEMRLTHEELVQAQGDLLKTVEGLDVVQREIRRIDELTKSGAIAGKTLIDLNYEKQKAEAVLRAQSQTLVLHGLSEKQVETIISSRKLLPSLSIYAPAGPDGAPKQADDKASLQVQELKVEQGQHVTAGDLLYVLADHRELFIEGKAFEQDVPAISKAVASDLTVTATLQSSGAQPEVISGLKVLYLANKVDADARTFRFYVSLPNRMLRENETPDGRRFLDWQFKPGQRMQIQVPVEKWADRIVLPIDAVVTEGSESFVFQANGDHFDRRPVHVEYRNQAWAVIANDGSLFPGDTIAKTAAFQLQTALKNQSGGAIDPHAGHSH